ncbi:MAG TPA: hypothetical protein VM120_07385 [Bryobacteraceae bacterium]|nr:hypothetical protein [Bryobacteraceae bacterium]
MVPLNLFHDISDTQCVYAEFEKQQVMERVQALDAKARRKGLKGLDPSKNSLIGLGMEVNAAGTVTKNGYGVFHLSWLAEQHPEWAKRVTEQIEAIRDAIELTQGMPLGYVIWAGMGGSAEDKAAYLKCGLLKKGPKLYVLDSTDPAKLKAILEDIERRSKLPIREALQRTLVVGMAMGMTSYEPVVNLQKIYALYHKHRIDSRFNFIYMTLPGSLLDQFAGGRGFQRIEVQLDGGNSTAGRHSSPLTCGSLYPLALARVDLREWIAGTFLRKEEIQEAFRLASFLHAHGAAGRDKITLMLPKAWEGAELWTKQDFEESLGKSEELGLKVIISEKVKLANYRAPKDSCQQRVFLAVVRKGDADGVADKGALLRRAGYPLAVMSFARGTVLSHYMQFVHHVVFGIAYLRKMNFVTQPSVELYKAITSSVVEEAKKAGGLEKTALWQEIRGGPRQAKFPGGITLYYNQLAGGPAPDAKTAPQIYASLCMRQKLEKRAEYAELTFFGDTRYAENGRAVRKVLEASAERLFRAQWKMPVDVYEGPAMNHSYHEMVIGHGRCFSTVILSDKPERIPEIDYTADYHRAQFLATQAALAQRGRTVVAIVMRDLEEGSRKALDSFFREALRYAKR